MRNIPGFGHFPNPVAVKLLGERLQKTVDDAVGAGAVEVFCDTLSWFVRGGTEDQQDKALKAIKDKFAL